MLNNITVVILTLNEEANVGRVLNCLDWAKRIVVVDSFSSDATESICMQYPNVQFYKKKFDSHAQQWNYAIFDTSITSDWILALDADYIVPKELVAEIEALVIPKTVNALYANFNFAIHGRILPSTVYPRIAVLFKVGNAKYIQDGHTQRLSFNGDSFELKNRIILDDRKSISHWIISQNKYAKLEAVKLCTVNELSLADNIRKKIIIAPALMLMYCLIVKRAFLAGWEGFFYTMQRVTFELMLSMYLLENIIVRKNKK
jgi:glycosyltransferase involved in cell wall biosynthesis